MKKTKRTTMALEVEHGALVEVPVYCDHKRGRNWAAIIRPDPRSPGGLARRFLARARGRYYYMIEGLSVGHAVEFGADYYTGSGRKWPERWYGVVVEITPTRVVLIEAKTPAEAFRIARELREEIEKTKCLRVISLEEANNERIERVEATS